MMSLRSNSTLTLTATVLAAVLVVANISSLNVALPELSRELGASQSDVQWMVDIYAFFLASLLLPAGALGDKFGRRTMLLLGITILGIANAATLFTEHLDFIEPNEAKLVIAFRALSGIGAAFIFPATLSTITTTLPPNKKERGVAIWTASVFFGGLSGVLLSGALIENYTWESVFLVMGILSAIILLFCWVCLPNSSSPEKSNLDPLGSLLSLLAIGGIVYAIMEGPIKGWNSEIILSCFIIGGVFLLAFVIWESKTSKPLLDVSVFKDRSVRSGSFSLLVQFIVAFGFFFVAVQFLAYVLGYGPLDTGLSFLPTAIGLFPASLIAIPLTKKLGFRAVGLLGLGLLGVSLYIGAQFQSDSSFTDFALVAVIYGAGIGLASPPATEIIVSSLPFEKQGVASALNDVLRELGAVVGIAIAGSMFNSGYRSSIDSLQEFPDQILQLAKESPALAPQLAASLETSMDKFLYEITASVADGWSDSLWALFFVVAGGVVFFALWAPGKRHQSKTDVNRRSRKTGLRYKEVTTYIEIEGSRRRDKIRVIQKRLDGA
ncbi:MAG: hypothetical protein CL501_03235 [Actinobacteria bacterium]|nr:hypothetical protein [Actinomycetota bacterium]